MERICRSLNTAATLWCSAAVGGFAGADRVAEAALMAAFVLIGNTALRPMVNLINRIPIDDGSTEATYRIHVTAPDASRDQVRDLVLEKLEAADYPVRDAQVFERVGDEVEIVATLAATGAAAESRCARSCDRPRTLDPSTRPGRPARSHDRHWIPSGR